MPALSLRTSASFGQLYTVILAMLILWIFSRAAYVQVWQLFVVLCTGIITPPVLYLLATQSSSSARQIAERPALNATLSTGRDSVTSQSSARRASPDSSRRSEQRRSSHNSNSSRSTSPTLISFVSSASSSTQVSSTNGSRTFKKLWQRSLSESSESRPTIVDPAHEHDVVDHVDGSTHFRPSCRLCRASAGPNSTAKRPSNKLATLASNTRRVLCPFHQQQEQVVLRIEEQQTRPQTLAATAMRRSASQASSGSSSAVLLDDESAEGVREQRSRSIDAILLAPAATEKPRCKLFKRHSSSASTQARRSSAASDERPQIPSRSTTQSEDIPGSYERKRTRLPKLFKSGKPSNKA